jgi:hypothetical protein
VLFDETSTEHMSGEDVMRSALCIESVGVNRIVASPEVEEVHGQLFAIVLRGPFFASTFAGHPDNAPNIETVHLARVEDLGNLVGRIRAAAEMHGRWKEISDDADRVAAAVRATWAPELGGTGVPAEYTAPPGFDDSGSGST